MNYFYLSFFWISYFFLHSIFAMNAVKNFFFSIGMKPQVYRLIYVIFATTTFLAILLFSAMINSEFIYQPGNLMKFIGLLLSGWGFIIAKKGFKSYDTKAFLGLGSLDPEDEFKTDGLLQKVRHPLYSGSILLIIGYFLFNPKVSTSITVSMMILYFIIGIYFEEKKLIKAFGQKYIDYKNKTPMLIPRFWKKS